MGLGGVLGQVTGISPTVTGLGTGHLPTMAQVMMTAGVRAGQLANLAGLGQIAAQGKQGLMQAAAQSMIRRRPRGPKPGWGNEPYRPPLEPRAPVPEPPEYWTGGYSGGGWHDMIPGYIGAVIGAAGGIGLGGGIYYGDMWAEYHPIRVMTHPSRSEDASCFKMDSDFAVQNVAAGGTMSPAAGVGVAVSGATGPAGGTTAGGSGTGSGSSAPATPAGGSDEEPLPGADGTVLGIIKGAGAESLEGQKAAAQQEINDLIRNQGYDPDNPNAGQQIANAHQDALTQEHIARNNYQDAVNNEGRLQSEYWNSGDPEIKAQLDAAHQATLQAQGDLNSARDARQNLSDQMADQRGAREHLNDINGRIEKLNSIADKANMLLDFVNLMNNDGMSAAEATFTSYFGNTAANAATANIGTADFAAGVFFPQSLQGYVPGNVVKDSVKAGTNAIKALSSFAGGDEEAINQFGQSALNGQQGVVGQGYAELAGIAGTMWDDPLSALGDFGQGVKEIWNAGPLSLAGDAINNFAGNCLAGKEGPMAQTMAEVANAAGDLTVNPGEKIQQIGNDVNTIMQHGQPSDIIFGDEGSQRATQILGPIGQGYAELGQLGGEIVENPGGFIRDVKDTTGYVAGEAWQGVKDGASGLYNWGKSWF